MFKDKPFVTADESTDHSMNGRENFLRETYNHKFCVCPRGNGVDTHRLYEALYLKTIPIVVRHRTHDILYDLPIFFINDWDELANYTDEDFNRIYDEMITRTYNMDKLKMKYWLSFILNTNFERTIASAQAIIASAQSTIANAQETIDFAQATIDCAQATIASAQSTIDCAQETSSQATA